jgi:hypothetical protein
MYHSGFERGKFSCISCLAKKLFHVCFTLKIIDGMIFCNGRIFTDRTIGRNACKDSSLVDYLTLCFQMSTVDLVLHCYLIHLISVIVFTTTITN